jgi:hypothetical protein
MYTVGLKTVEPEWGKAVASGAPRLRQSFQRRCCITNSRRLNSKVVALEARLLMDVKKIHGAPAIWVYCCRQSAAAGVRPLVTYLFLDESHVSKG